MNELVSRVRSVRKTEVQNVRRVGSAKQLAAIVNIFDFGNWYAHASRIRKMHVERVQCAMCIVSSMTARPAQPKS